MKVYVGAMTRAGHITVDGPHMVSAHGGRWFVYIPQGASDPIMRVRHGSTQNFNTMGDEQVVPVPDPAEVTTFMPAFRAVLTMRGAKVQMEITDGSEVAS